MADPEPKERAHSLERMHRTHRFEARSVWAALLSMVGFATACGQPGAPRAALARTQAISSGSNSAASEAAPSAESTRAALLACIPKPALIVRPGCVIASTKTPPVVCTDLSPSGSPDVDVLSIVVARGRFDFARTLGIPSMQAALDAGTPGAEAMAKVYRDFEGPHWERLSDGRRVKLEARGLMLGGVVRWVTLPSPKVTFTTVLVQQIPLHDAPLADGDRAAVVGWDLPAMLACIDGRFWGGTAQR